MTLDARIRTQIGSLELDVGLQVEPGELVALLGPNGAGKSTVLRSLAGLLPIDAGRIAIDDIVVDEVVADDPSASRFVPPEARAVGMVFQDYLLFPQLTVLENVAYGLRAHRMARRDARATAASWLQRVGLDGYAQQLPGVLSGGQAQRVALARAMVTSPRLLLLDEPLAALDVATRSQVRRDLRHALEQFDGMRLLVTHDPVDAYALADRVVVMEHGAIVQSGTLAQVTAHPRSRYIAELIGVNLFRGVADGELLTTVDGAQIVVADAASGTVFASIRPQAISLHRERPTGTPRNVWACTIVDIDLFGDRARVGLAGPLALVAEVTGGAVHSLGLRPGDEVFAAVKATEIETYPA